MIRKSSIFCSAVAIAAAIGFTYSAAQAETLRLVNAWPSNQTTVRVIAAAFIKKVSEHTNGAIEISAVGPEAIHPLEQLEPLQNGIIDMIFTHPAYHAGTAKIGLTGSAIRVNPNKWRVPGGVFDQIDAFYNTIGIKLIVVAPLGKTGFRFVAREAIDGKEHSFSGMKVRANASYIAIIEKLGGSPVPLSGGEIYSSLQNGVVDAAPWARTGMMDFKLQEVTSYVVQPDFGSLNNWIFMNLDKWNSLDDAAKAGIEKAAKETELYALEEMERLSLEELQNLQDAGLKITRMNDVEAANIADWMAEAMWKLSNSTSVEFTTKIHDAAIKAGLAK